jgi:hypothetical protein
MTLRAPVLLASLFLEDADLGRLGLGFDEGVNFCYV